MEIIRNENDQPYISKATQSLINRGFISDDTLIEPKEFGFTLTLEPVFRLSDDKLRDGKRASEKLPLHFKEEMIFDFGVTGGSYFKIIDDKIFFNNTNTVYDLSGNFIKKIAGLDTHSFSLIDKTYNKLILFNDEIFCLDEHFEVEFKFEKIYHNKNALSSSNTQQVLFTMESVFVGYGNSWGSCFIVKHDRAGKVIQKIKLERGFCLVAIGRNPDQLFTYNRSKAIYKIYDTELHLIKELPGVKDDTDHIVSPDNNYLVASSPGKTFISAINLKDGSSFKIDVHPVHDKNYKFRKKNLGIALRFVSFLDYADTLFISGDKFRTIAYSFNDNSQTILRGHDDTIHDMFFSGVNAFSLSTDHSHVLTSATDCKIIVWDPNFTIKGQLVGHNLQVTHAVYLNDLNKIVSTSVDGTVRIWTAL